MILITGASGNVGCEIVKLFEQNKINCIASGRRNLWHDCKYVSYHFLDLEDPSSYNAVEGVSQVFLVRPPQISNVKKHITPFLHRCKEYGVEKIVFLSINGVQKLPFIPHFAIEKEIYRIGFSHTFLRAGFFMQNISTTHAQEIKERSELVAPCGNGKTTFIHARDIATVGFKSLKGEITDTYLDVTGEDTLTYGQIADKLTAVLGRKITYRSPSPIGFIRYRMKYGTPLSFSIVMTGIYMPTRFGAAQKNDSEIRKYLGRAPVSFDQFLQEEKQVWM